VNSPLQKVRRAVSSHASVNRNSGEYEANPVVIYDYQPSRGGLCVRDFLGNYSGYVLTDGYAGYDTLSTVTQAGCWAHARRYFIEAQKSQPKKKVGRVEKALNYLGKLYGVEREAKALSPEERQALRQEKSVPILDELYQWLVETQPSVVPKSALGKAVNYLLNQCVFR
jgi:transposase